MTGSNAVEVGHLIESAPIGRVQINVIVCCTIMMLLDGYDIQTMALVVPVVADHWGVPASSFGSVLSASLVGIMAGTLIGGALGDRIGRRPMLLGGFALVGVSSLATALAGTMVDFLLCRFLTGLGIGAVLPNAMTLIADYAPKRVRAIWVTIAGCSVSLGAFAAGIAGSQLIPRLGWESIFIIGGIVPLLLMLVMWRWIPESIPFLLAKDPRSPAARRTLAQMIPGFVPTDDCDYRVTRAGVQGGAVQALWTDGRAIGTVLLWCIFSAGLLLIYLLISWLPTLFTRAGQPIEQALIAASAFQLGGMVGGLLLGWLLAGFGASRPLAAAYLLGALALLLIGQVSGLAQLMGLAFVIGATIFGAQVGLNVVAANLYPAGARATGIGWAQGVGRVGAIAGPLAGGAAVAAGWSSGLLFGLLAAVAVACALLAIATARAVRSLDVAAIVQHD